MKFAVIKKILLNAGDLNPEAIIIRLIEDERNQKIELEGDGTDNTSAKALAVATATKGAVATATTPRARHQQRSRPPHRNAGKKMECWYCGKKGHRQSECHKKKRDDKNGGQPRYDPASIPPRAPGRIQAAVATVSEEYPTTCYMAGHATDVNTWLVDSGASDHLCRDMRVFQSLRQLIRPSEVFLGDGSVIHATHQGTIILNLASGLSINIEALLVPRLHQSLLSMCKLTESHHATFFQSGKHFLIDRHEIGVRKNRTIEFTGSTPSKQTVRALVS